jgi:hypothetical protein
MMKQQSCKTWIWLTGNSKVSYLMLMCPGSAGLVLLGTCSRLFREFPKAVQSFVKDAPFCKDKSMWVSTDLTQSDASDLFPAPGPS